MHRRAFLVMLTLPAVVVALEGCSSGPGGISDGGITDGGITDGETGSLVQSDVARVDADASQALVAAAAVNRFGTSLYRVLAAAGPGVNMVLSPVSVALALTMTAGGARGATLDEMIETLDVDDPAGVHRAMNALTAQLAARSTGSGDDEIRLEIANSLWGQAGLRFDDTFVDLLASEYGAGVHVVDFAADPNAARTAINGWVDDATAQRIPELLTDGSVTEFTRLALVNAIHMKAQWAQQFSEDATVDSAFTLADGTEVDVPTMVSTGEYAYASGDGWQAVELPYVGGDLAMLVFLPEEGFLELFESIFLVTDATQYLEPRRVALRLPRWNTGSTVSLADTLAALGMPLAFSEGADFTGITADTKLAIDAVAHEANITVDEFGTEAAAATAVETAVTSGPEPEEPIEVTVDRSFVFAVRDRVSGALLFLGRVADPRS